MFSDGFEVEGRTFWPGEFFSSFPFLLFSLRFLFNFVFVRRHDHSTRPGPAYRLLCVFAHVSITSSPNLCAPFLSRASVFRRRSCDRSTIDAIFIIFVLSAVMMQRSFRFLSSWPPAYPLMTMTMLWFVYVAHLHPVRGFEPSSDTGTHLRSF